MRSHWQTQNFVGEAFGDRQSARRISQLRIGAAEVRRDGIVDQRLNSFPRQRFAEKVALSMTDYEQVPFLPSPATGPIRFSVPVLFTLL